MRAVDAIAVSAVTLCSLVVLSHCVLSHSTLALSALDSVLSHWYSHKVPRASTQNSAELATGAAQYCQQYTDWLEQ